MFDPPELPSRTTRAVTVCLFLVAGFLIYGASLKNGFVRWDDGMLIYQNPAVMETSFASVKRAFTTYDPELYVPLTLLSYQMDYLIGGGAPFMFHLHSLILHILNAVLVAWLAFLLFKNRFVALLAGLIFLAHPLHVEAVSWASGRKDLLSASWFLGSILCYLYFRARGKTSLLWWSLVMFALGLMSKVMIVTLPVILLLLDLRLNGRVTVRDLVQKTPYFILSALFGIVALFGKQGVSAASTILEKVLMGAKSTMFYLQKLFFPADLSVVYPYEGVISILSPDFTIPVALLTALTVVVLLTLTRTREIAVWFFFFLITLLPTFVNIVKGDYDVYIASDRYAYLPSIGIIFILAYGLTRIMDADVPVAAARVRGRIAGVTAACVLLLFASLSSAQSLVWRNSITLFEHALAHAPEASYSAHNNLGNAYRSSGQFAEAIDQYTKAIELKPHSTVYSNLGSAYRRAGKYAEAMDAYQKALQMDPENSLAHFGMGALLASLGQMEDALFAYTRALELEPDSAEVYVNIGAAKDKQGKTDEAIEAFGQAIRLNPRLPDAYYNLAVVQTKKYAYDEAIVAYEQAIALDPHNIPARINLGLLYSQKGDTDSAAGQFRAILKTDPANKTAQSALRQLGAE